MNIKLSKNINDNDELGRGSFSTKDVNKSGKIRYSLFFYKEKDTISVDRLFDFCLEKLAAIQDGHAQERKQKFYGWASIKALDAKKNRRKVQSSPIENNPYHANIILPKNIEDDDRRSFAKELAFYSKWVERYKST